MSSTALTPKAAGFPFLNLPLELRQQIYLYCIPQNLTLNFVDEDDTGYHQERPNGWHPTESGNLKGEAENYYTYKPGYCTICDSADAQDSQGDTTSNKNAEEANKAADKWYSPHSLLVDRDWCSDCSTYRLHTPPKEMALPGLLLVCRQITDEVETLLYGGNTFVADLDLESKRGIWRLSDARREKMRKLVLVLQAAGESYYPAFMVDSEIWQPVFRNLLALGIVAREPVPEGESWYDRCTWEEEFDEWEAWLEPTLESISQGISGTTLVVADADEKERTMEIIQRVTSGLCHFERLPMGD